jgi:hypothetical protein
MSAAAPLSRDPDAAAHTRHRLDLRILLDKDEDEGDAQEVVQRDRYGARRSGGGRHS